MFKQTIVQRILAARLPAIAERLQDLAEQQGIDVEVMPKSQSGLAQLSVQGPNLMSQQFGGPDTLASAPVSRLLQSLAQIRRQI